MELIYLIISVGLTLTQRDHLLQGAGSTYGGLAPESTQHVTMLSLFPLLFRQPALTFIGGDHRL